MEDLGTAHTVPIVAPCTLGIVSFRASYPRKKVAAAFSNKLLQHLVILKKKNGHFRNCSAMEPSLKVSVFWDMELKACFGGIASYLSLFSRPSQKEPLGLLAIIDLSTGNINAFSLRIYVTVD